MIYAYRKGSFAFSSQLFAVRYILFMLCHKSIKRVSSVSPLADYEYDFYGFDYRNGGCGNVATGGVNVGYSPEPFYEDYYRTFEGGGEYFYEYAPTTGMNLSPVANGGLPRGVRSNANAVGDSLFLFLYFSNFVYLV